MPIMTTLLASGGILLAGLTGIHPATSPAPHVETAASASVAQATASAFSVSNYVDGQTVSSPTLYMKGTAEPGSKIWLVRGATGIGGGTTGADGRWTLQQFTDLSEGINHMSFLVVSPQGVQQEVAFDLNVDSAPIITTAAATTRLSSVFLFSSSVTTEARPVIEGLATSGATITITTQSGAVVGQATVDSSDMFSLRLTSDLKPGYNELGLTQTLNGATTVSPASVTFSK